MCFVEYPYIFVWDARFSYTESHTLALLAKRFVETRARIVSPCVKDYCNSTTGEYISCDKSIVSLKLIIIFAGSQTTSHLVLFP